MNVFEKLQNARVKLQNMDLKKSGENAYSKFKYYELSDFLPFVNKIFEENKLFSNFSIEENRATLTVINTEKPDETIVFISPVEELELKGCNKIQALGGVHTYLKRYLYLNALEIVENDMFDSVSGRPDKKPQKSSEKEVKTNFDDSDIYAYIDEISEVSTLSQYYNEAKEKVSDRKEFYAAIQKRREEILKLKEQNK